MHSFQPQYVHTFPQGNGSVWSLLRATGGRDSRGQWGPLALGRCRSACRSAAWLWPPRLPNSNASPSGKTRERAQRLSRFCSSFTPSSHTQINAPLWLRWAFQPVSGPHTCRADGRQCCGGSPWPHAAPAGRSRGSFQRRGLQEGRTDRHVIACLRQSLGLSCSQQIILVFFSCLPF